MSKLLTIAVPTYNRAQLLDDQLGRLMAAIKGFEDQCEILISDNCSTDHTSEVMSKWKEKLDSIALTTYQHTENKGAIRNISFCMTAATGQYVWVVSDDDKLSNMAIAKVIHSIQDYDNLGLLVLNHSCCSSETGEVFTQQRYPLDADDWNADGKALFSKYLDIDYGGLVLTTALVYRTDLAKRALEKWPDGIDNIMYQLYISAFCAQGGSACLTQDSVLEWMTGRAFFSKNTDFFIQIQLADLQNIYAKLAEIGYSQTLCRRLVLRRVFSKEWLLLVVKLHLKYPKRSLTAVKETVITVWKLCFQRLHRSPV